jgi:hypothetical protein
MKVDVEKRQYWEGRIAAWQTSGLTQRAFCERERLKRPTFDYWRRRIKPQALPVQRKPQHVVRPMTLVPVQVERSGSDAAPMELHGPGGWRLIVPVAVDARWLAALMQSLA